MNLLLVDDEVHAAERIQKMLDWETLGIRQVFLAHSMSQAMRIFERDPIDIMLCDIEMPQGNGIELATWVRAKGFRTAIIFLTCHAQFTYAKDAMRLRSQDYLLKPVDKETLENALLRTVTYVQQEQRIERITQSDALWQNNRCNIQEYFWLQVAQGSFSDSDKEIIRIANVRGLQIPEDAKLYALLIILQKFDESWKTNDRRLMTYAQLNIARELFEAQGLPNAVVELQRGVLLVVCCPSKKEDLQQIEQCAKHYTEVCKTHVGLELRCCISGLIAPSELCETSERLLHQEPDMHKFPNSVWIENAAKNEKTSFKRPDIEMWSNMLSRKMYRQVREAVIAYFQDPSVAASISPHFLYSFQQEILQMAYDYCQREGMAVRNFLKEDVELQARAVRSVPDMLIWINKLIDHCERPEFSGSNDPIRDAKQYIAENIDQDISREDIANYVHLNPDYLSRIFKKEVGISIIEYLIHLRIEMAKKLLLETNMRVSDVAAQVGYSNFSHFSKIFKKKVGVNPNQFKRTEAGSAKESQNSANKRSF